MPSTTDADALPPALIDLRDRHLAFYLAFASRTTASLNADSTQAADRESLRRMLLGEADNVRAALTWALDAVRVDEALMLYGSTAWIWVHVPEEGRRWGRRVLAGPAGDPRARGTAGLALAMTCAQLGDTTDAARVATEACRQYELAGDRAGQAAAWRVTGDLRLHDAPGEAADAYQHAATLYASLGSDAEAWEHAAALRGIAWARARSGDAAKDADGGDIDALLEQARTILVARGEPSLLARHASSEADLRAHLGQAERAREARAEALRQRRAAGDRHHLVEALQAGASDALAAGRLEEADALLTEILGLCATDDRRTAQRPRALSSLGMLALFRGDRMTAASLLDEAARGLADVVMLGGYERALTATIARTRAAIARLDGDIEGARRSLWVAAQAGERASAAAIGPDALAELEHETGVASSDPPTGTSPADAAARAELRAGVLLEQADHAAAAPLLADAIREGVAAGVDLSVIARLEVMTAVASALAADEAGTNDALRSLGRRWRRVLDPRARARLLLCLAWARAGADPSVARELLDAATLLRQRCAVTARDLDRALEARARVPDTAQPGETRDTAQPREMRDADQLLAELLG